MTSKPILSKILSLRGRARVGHWAGELLVATAAAVIGGCKRGNTAAPPPMPAPMVVTVAAMTVDVPVYIDGIGKCVALESVTITPRIAGQIVERHFEDGASIKQGQKLFSIDPEPAKAALESAKAQLAQANAAKDFAKIELGRYTAVAGTKAISKSDLDTKQNALDVAQAQVASADAALRTAQLNLEYCTIISPIDGRAGARLVDVGNVVKANEGSLLSIQKLVPIYADFTVNEDQLAAVRANMANGTLQTLVSLPEDAAPSPGELTFLDNAVQDGTGTVRLRAFLKNEDEHFWPGQFVNVRLVLKVKTDAVVVPSSAPQTGQSGPFVLVIHKDDVAELRPVVLGQAQQDWIVIENGLKKGERVVTDGQMMVRPNAPVRVQPAAATTPSQAASFKLVLRTPTTRPASGPSSAGTQPTSRPVAALPQAMPESQPTAPSTNPGATK